MLDTVIAVNLDSRYISISALEEKKKRKNLWLSESWFWRHSNIQENDLAHTVLVIQTKKILTEKNLISPAAKLPFHYQYRYTYCTGTYMIVEFVPSC